MPSSKQQEIATAFARLSALPRTASKQIIDKMAELQRAKEVYEQSERMKEAFLTGAGSPFFPVQRFVNWRTGSTAEELYGEPSTFGQKAALFGVETLGALPSMLLPIGAGSQAAKGTTVLGRLAAGAKAAAPYGAGFGFLGGVYDPKATPVSVVESTIMGTGAAGVLGSAGAGLGMAIRRIQGKPWIETTARELTVELKPQAQTIDELLTGASYKPTGLSPEEKLSLHNQIDATIPVPVAEPSLKNVITVKHPHAGLESFSRKTLKESVDILGAKGVVVAIAPRLESSGLTVNETTGLFAQTLVARDKAQTLQFAKLLSLQKHRNVVYGASSEAISANADRMILTKGRLVELGEYNSLTDAELLLYRDAAYRSTEHIGSAGRRRAVRKAENIEGGFKSQLTPVIGTPDQPLISTPTQVHKLEVIISPRPAGTASESASVIITEAPNKLNTATISSTLPEEVLQNARKEAKASLLESLKTRLNIIAKEVKDPKERVAAAVDANREYVTLLKDLESQAAGLSDVEKVKLYGKGGLAQTLKLSEIDHAANIIITHAQSGVDEPILKNFVRRALANGHQFDPETSARLKLFAPDVFTIDKSVELNPVSHYTITVKGPGGTSQVKIVSGVEYKKLHAQGQVNGHFGELPPNHALLTSEEGNALVKGIGLEPEIPSYYKQLKAKIGHVIDHLPQPLRVFMIHKAPGLLEAFRQHFSGITKNRILHFDSDIAEIQGSWAKLPEEGRKLLWKKLYGQERETRSVFSPVGKHLNEIDRIGRLITDFRLKVFKFKAETYRTDHGYYSPEATASLKHQIDSAIEKNLEEVKHWMPHQWSHANDFLMFYQAGADGLKEFIRVSVPVGKLWSQARTSKEFETAVQNVIKEYGSKLKKDSAGKVMFTHYNPETYIKAYGNPNAKILPDYETALNMVNKMPGLAPAERERFLTLAARGSGQPQLAARKWIAGYNQTPVDSIKYLMDDVEHALHQRSLVDGQTLWAKAIDEAEDSIKPFAREYRDALFRSTPDYTYKYRSFLYTTMLGWKFSFMIQQKVQNVMWAPSYFINKYGSKIRQTASALAECERYQFTKIENLPDQYKGAMKWLKANGAFESDVLSEGGHRTYSQLVDPSAYHSVQHSVNWMGNRLEQANRQGLAIASVFLQKDSGRPLEEIARHAHLDILGVHDAYTRMNRPLWLMRSGRLEPALAVTWMFQSFPARTMMQLLQMAAPGGSKKALALQMAILTAGAGALGYPGVKTAAALYKLGTGGKGDLKGDVHDAFQNITDATFKYFGADQETAKNAGQFGADIVAYGGPGALGIDATTFLGISNFPYGDVLDTGAPGAIGLYTTFFKKGSKTYAAAQQGDLVKMLENGMPMAQAQNALTAYRWHRDGVVKDFNEIPLTRRDGSSYTVTGKDEALAVLGIPTIDKTRAYEERIHRKAILEAMTRKRAELNRNWAKALFERDGDALRKVQTKMNDHNADIKKRMERGEDVSEEYILKPNAQSIKENMKLLQFGRTVETARTMQERRMMLAQQQKQQ